MKMAKLLRSRNLIQESTERAYWIDAVEYAAWCQDVEVGDCVKSYGRYLGNRFIRTYYKSNST